MPDSPHEEFVAEAQEVIEAVAREIERLDADHRAGAYDPDVVQALFRAVHSLKGLAGVFGMDRIAQVAHDVETVLDGLRMGRVDTGAILDPLFLGGDLLARMVAAAAGGPEVSPDEAQRLIDRLRTVELRAPDRGEDIAAYDLGQDVLDQLTDYEAHRLRVNARAGASLVRVRGAFAMETLDRELDALKSLVKPLGEWIATLPGIGAGEPGTLGLELLVGCPGSPEEVRRALAGRPVEVVEVQRRQVLRPIPVAAPLAPAAPARAAPAEEPSLRSLARTVRVDIRKLDGLMNLTGELGVSCAGLGRVLARLRGVGQTEVAREMAREVRALDRRVAELRAAVLDARMVPLAQVFEKLVRVGRRLAREAGKEVRIRTLGAETEIDKLIVEDLSDPLVHLIRNAIDHGIEPVEERRRAGKDEAGDVHLRAAPRGNHVVIEVADDGRGLDPAVLKRRALAGGLLDEAAAAALAPEQALALVFAPGFSTKDEATDVSGRGVGLDVVKTNIAKLSGLIDIESEPGRGACFRITVPITLAILRALIVRVAGRTFALPINAVVENVRARASELRLVGGREVATLRGASLPVVRLGRLFGLGREAGGDDTRNGWLHVVVAGVAERRLGLAVDEIAGQQDIVIKPLGAALAGVPGIAGATELGGGLTVLVLDVPALLAEGLGAPGGSRPTPAATAAVPAPGGLGPAPPAGAAAPEDRR